MLCTINLNQNKNKVVNRAMFIHPGKDRCTILVKIDVLDRYGAMICSYFGIVFLLLFKKIENAVYIYFHSLVH